MFIRTATSHKIAWNVLTRERNIRVSVAGHRGDLGAPIRMFSELFDAERAGALRKALRFLKLYKASWNDQYIATTVAGQNYRGTLVGVAGSDFMMRVEGKPDDWIAVGHSSDIPPGSQSKDALDIKPKNWSTPKP